MHVPVQRGTWHSPAVTSAAAAARPAGQRTVSQLCQCFGPSRVGGAPKKVGGVPLEHAARRPGVVAGEVGSLQAAVSAAVSAGHRCCDPSRSASAAWRVLRQRNAGGVVSRHDSATPPARSGCMVVSGAPSHRERRCRAATAGGGPACGGPARVFGTPYAWQASAGCVTEHLLLQWPPRRVCCARLCCPWLFDGAHDQAGDRRKFRDLLGLRGRRSVTRCTCAVIQPVGQ